MISRKGTGFSRDAMEELAVLESAAEEILSLTERAFGKRDQDAAFGIEPLVRVMGDLIDKIKGNHLTRMCSGRCSVYSDVIYMNILTEYKRIASVCSNVGAATIIRIRPALADQEHEYYSDLRAGRDAQYNKAYKQARDTYFSQLKEADRRIP